LEEGKIVCLHHSIASFCLTNRKRIGKSSPKSKRKQVSLSPFEKLALTLAESSGVEGAERKSSLGIIIVKREVWIGPRQEERRDTDTSTNLT